MLLLTAECLSIVLEEEAPEKPTGDDYDKQDAYEYFHSRDSKAMLYIFGSVDKSITDSMKGIISAKGMVDKLKEIFSQTDVHEHHELVGLIHNAKMMAGTPRNVILNSLPSSYSLFICNFNINKLDVELTELGNILQEAEKAQKKEKDEVNATEVKSSTSKNKWKKKKDNKSKTLRGKGGKIQKKKEEPKGTSFFCKKEGHWKRNCRVYLATLKKSDETPKEGVQDDKKT
ncbi:uncharacterized protein LOC122064776 [Macadamia integrifolia]|uniref:uncharacterized protein LOC122064776 n=1 Tax=Macadamia integrifolia TaxID=60698 RepID=UPI001C4FD207|nr:uncharacterized protein LOC122064776 [Macadamia integrifolia]